MGSLSLLQGIFPTQGWNPGLPHCRWILYQLSHKGSLRYIVGAQQTLGWPEFIRVFHASLWHTRMNLLASPLFLNKGWKEAVRSPGRPPHRGGNLRLGLERGKEAGMGVSLLRGEQYGKSSIRAGMPPTRSGEVSGTNMQGDWRPGGTSEPLPTGGRGLGVPEPSLPAAPCPGLVAP